MLASSPLWQEFERIWRVSSGDPRIRVALLDGPADLEHPAFGQAAMSCLAALRPCREQPLGAAIEHGTRVASIVFARHERGAAGRVRGVAPRCSGLIVPIFRSVTRGASEPCSQVDLALAGCDALLLPALAIPAPPLGAGSIDVDGTPEPVRAAMLRLTQLFNLTGHPAIAMPAGTEAGGLPVGMQLVGRCRETFALLDAAEAVEAQMDGGAGSVGGGTG